MLKSVLRPCHRWLGLILLLPLMVEGLSGTVLALDPIWPRFGPAASEGVAAPANDILAAARKLAPPGMRAARYTPPAEAGEAAELQFLPVGVARGQGVVVRIDPVSLQQIGDLERPGGFVEWARRLHSNLLIPEYAGRSILGWEGVGLLLLVVMGVPLWWPAKGQARAAFTVPAKARGVRLHRRLHGAVGIWMLPVMLVAAVTGIAMGFPQTTRHVLGVAAGGPPRASPGPPPGPVDLDAAIALAQAAVPGTAPRMVFLPGSARDPVRLFMSPPGRTGAVATSMVAVADGRLVSAQDSRTLSAADQAVRWMHDLHAGQGIGLLGRLLVATGGPALLIFGVTGAAMWLLKRRNRRRIADARQNALQPGD